MKWSLEGLGGETFVTSWISWLCLCGGNKSLAGYLRWVCRGGVMSLVGSG